MYQVNISRVRGKMGEKGLTISDLSNMLGINRNTLSAYFRSPQRIPYNTLSRMASILCDDPDEARTIFFAH